MVGNVFDEVGDGVDAEQPDRCAEYEGEIRRIPFDRNNANSQVEGENNHFGDKMVPSVMC